MNTLTFKRWVWLEHGVLPLLLTILRACWWLPWLMLLQRLLAPEEPGVVLPMWQLLTLPLLSLLLARLVSPPVEESSNLHLTSTPAAPAASLTGRIGIALLGLLLILLVLWLQLYRHQFGLLDAGWLAALGDSLIHWNSNAVPGAVIIGLFGAFLWLRGLLDASMRMAHDDVWAVFRTGIVALVLYLIFSALGGVALTSRDAFLALTMLASGMAALAASSLKVTAGLDRALGVGQRTSASMPGLSRSWLISVTTVIPLLLVVGVALGALLAPEMVATLLGWLRDVASAIGWVIGQVALFIAYLLFMIFYYIARLLAPLFQGLFPDEEVEPEQMLMQEQPDGGLEQLQRDVAVIPDTYRWIGLAVVVVVLLIIFVIVIRRLRAAAQEELDESRESILSADLLEAQLGNLWRNLSDRFRGAAEALHPFLTLDGEIEARRQIRTVYQHLLQTATEMGSVREAHATPAEYQARLPRALAVRSDSAAERQATQELVAQELAILTERYYLARYGNAPPSTEDVQAAQQAWQQMQTYFQAEDEADRG